MTPVQFAEITTALARTLDPQHLAAAVGALATMVAADDAASVSSTDDTSACERARAAFAANPTLSIGELMQTAHCSSGTAIAARRQVRNGAVNSDKKMTSVEDRPQQVAEKPRQNTQSADGREAPRPAGNGAAPPPTALQKAEQFLQHQLAKGPRQEIHLRAAANIAKISPAVLDKAAEDLGIRQRYNGTEPIWSLPAPIATESAASQ